MNWRRVQISIQKFWSWLCRQWAEGAEIQRRIDVERLKAQERHGSGSPARWL